MQLSEEEDKMNPTFIIEMENGQTMKGELYPGTLRPTAWQTLWNWRTAVFMTA